MVRAGTRLERLKDVFDKNTIEDVLWINLEMRKVIFDVAHHKVENLTIEDALRMRRERLPQGHFSGSCKTGKKC